MEDMENMEAEDIYYVEIKNNKRFKGIYVNKKAILESEIVDEEISSIKTEVDNIINDISNLNIDNEFKRYLLKSELRTFKLKSELKHLKVYFEILKHDLLGAENDNVDIDETIDEN